MDFYHIFRKGDDDDDSYWVRAESGLEARRLVAKNIQGAPDAEDNAKFDCLIDAGKTPPDGFIHRRLHGPVSITKR